MADLHPAQGSWRMIRVIRTIALQQGWLAGHLLFPREDLRCLDSALPLALALALA